MAIAFVHKFLQQDAHQHLSLQRTVSGVQNH
jgi:hypothetical protein